VRILFFFWFGGVSDLLGPPFFLFNLFGSTIPVKRDDLHLLAHAMASDFSDAWQFLSKRTIGYVHALKVRAILY
jgi:hypothetical protein